MEAELIDLTIANESFPIDLSTKKRKRPAFDEPSSELPALNHKLNTAKSHKTAKLEYEQSHNRLFPDHYKPSKPPEFCQNLRVDIPMPNIPSGPFYFGGSLVKLDGVLVETKPGLLLSPPPESDPPCSDVGDLRESIVPPMMTLSPALYSPISMEPPSSPTNSIESTSRTHLLLASPGLDSSSTIPVPVLEQAHFNRYRYNVRQFNILAKELMDDCNDPVLQSIATVESSYLKFSRRRGKGGDERDGENHGSYRNKKSLAYRKSKARRKMKADLMIQATARYNQESLDMLREIAEMQKILLERRYQHPLPYQHEINSLYCELDLD